VLADFRPKAAAIGSLPEAILVHLTVVAASAAGAVIAVIVCEPAN